MDNLGQVVIDSEQEMIKKKNKHAAKRKEQLIKLCVLVESPLSLYLKFFLFLSPYFVSASMPALITIPISCFESSTIMLSSYMPTPVFYLGSLVLLSFHYMSTPAASLALSLPRHTFVSCCGISALLLLLFLLSPPLSLRSSLLRTFKQSLSDEPWPWVLTSLIKLFCPFLAFGAYNPDNNNGLHNLTNINKLKRNFNTTFINSCLLTSYL